MPKNFLPKLSDQDISNDEKPSKSALKRQAETAQMLGEKLMTLKPAELDNIPISEPLKAAIITAKKLTSHGAIRRQKQLIGKYMRQTDLEAIEEAYLKVTHQHISQVRDLHLLESWVEQLIAGENDIIRNIAESTIELDRQHLRHLQHKAITHPNTTNRRALFRYLKERYTAMQIQQELNTES